MSQQSQESEIYLQDLLAMFEATKQTVNKKWDAFKSHLETNKNHWSDTQYFYFHKRVEEIEQGLHYMNKQIDGDVRNFIEDNINHYRTIQNK